MLLGLGGLAGAALLGKTYLEAFRQNLAIDGRSVDTTPVALSIGGTSLLVPGNMIRFDAGRKPGATERIDLMLLWPELEGLTAANAARFRPTPSGPPPLVFVTLRASDSAGDSTSRLDEVYTRFFSDEAWAGPAGLVGVRLDEKSGYAGEDLFFQAESDKPFVARCLAAREGGLPETCLREISVEGLSVTYRFDKPLLEEWNDLDAAVSARVERLIRR